MLTVYDDGYGIPTVGLGHRIYPGDNLKIGDSISVEQCKKYMRAKLAEFENLVNKAVKVPLHQYEYDAIVSIIWNTGPHHAKHDPWPEKRVDYLVKTLNSGDYDSMPDFIRGFIAERVRSRRESEARLFATGVYDARH
jgi:lysozyme